MSEKETPKIGIFFMLSYQNDHFSYLFYIQRFLSSTIRFSAHQSI